MAMVLVLINLNKTWWKYLQWISKGIILRGFSIYPEYGKVLVFAAYEIHTLLALMSLLHETTKGIIIKKVKNEVHFAVSKPSGEDVQLQSYRDRKQVGEFTHFCTF